MKWRRTNGKFVEYVQATTQYALPPEPPLPLLAGMSEAGSKV